MSPEQANGRPVDARSDIFSLGIVLHEAISGRPAFHGDTAATSFLRCSATIRRGSGRSSPQRRVRSNDA
jgi:serine/threonine protein kinase